MINTLKINFIWLTFTWIYYYFYKRILKELKKFLNWLFKKIANSEKYIINFIGIFEREDKKAILMEYAFSDMKKILKENEQKNVKFSVIEIKNLAICLLNGLYVLK